VIGHKEFDDLKAYMIEIMCMPEMCFPPSFFDMQEHLMIHLVDQILTLGPLYLHSIFLYEQFLAVLKACVRNRAHLEGSVVECYTTKEVVECCIDYIKDGKWVGLPIPLHEGKLGESGRMSQKTFVDRDYSLVGEAYFNVLQQLMIAESYIDEHLSELRRDNIDCTDAWIMKEYQHVFTTWLMDKNIPTKEMMKKMLASHPSSCVTSWQAYDIRIEAFDPLGVKTTYYRYIRDIWELDYGTRLQIPIFKCQWVKHLNSVSMDNYGLTLVDLKNVGHKDDPRVLANHVAQVFYVLDPKTEKRIVVSENKKLSELRTWKIMMRMSISSKRFHYSLIQ
jgi:hypothetical protein